MKHLPLVALWFATAVCAPAETPAPLQEALKKGAEDSDRWAFTETTVTTDKNGKRGAETIVRFDPSKPYVEQFTPLKIKGKVPTEKQLAEYRKRGERRGKQEEEAATKKEGEKEDEPARIDINGDKAIIDLEHAKVANETESSLTYEIPLRRDGAHSLPVEKFKLLIRVNKERQVMENASLHLVDALRLKLVAKVSRGVLSADFAVVHPEFAPVMTELKVDIGVSVLFMKKDSNMEQKRSDFQRVKPYRDRFGVKLGPLNALPF